MTIKERALDFIDKYPGKSAYLIAEGIDAPLASVSSILRRMADKGELVRVSNLGPRNGYGYFLPGKEPKES